MGIIIYCRRVMDETNVVEGKTEAVNNEESETRNSKNNRNRNRQPKEKITLDTVIPALPKKQDRLTKPDKNKMEEEIKKIEGQIEKTFNDMKNFNKEIDTKKQGSKASNNATTVKDRLQLKYGERKEIKSKKDVEKEALDYHQGMLEKLQDEMGKSSKKLRYYSEEDAEQA